MEKPVIGPAFTLRRGKKTSRFPSSLLQRSEEMGTDPGLTPFLQGSDPISSERDKE
jgi:hypothetical protein